MTDSAKQLPGEITIRDSLRPGDLGRLISLHGTAYEPESEFGLAFEAYVAATIADFYLGNRARGQIWLAENAGHLVGCAAIVKRETGTGQLRWVLVDRRARGAGLGRKLVELALAYCRDSGMENVYLETTLGLPESMALYEDLGFEVESEDTVELWSGKGPIVVMRLKL